MICDFAKGVVVRTSSTIDVASVIHWARDQKLHQDSWRFLGRASKDQVAWEFDSKSTASLFKLTFGGL